MRLSALRTAFAHLVRYGAVALAAILTWGLAVEPRFILDRREFAIVLPRLPQELDGIRIAVIADFQIGMWLANRHMVDRAIAEIVALKPDAALIAGDFIYDWSEPESDDGPEELAEDMRERDTDIREVAAMLQPLTAAGVRTFAVLGNHDYGMMWPTSPPLPEVADALEHALERRGISVLRNTAMPLQPRHASASRVGPIYIVGIDAHLPQRDNVAAALRGVPDNAPRVAFMHHPESFAAIPAGRAPLAIAAHTHGGQIRLPFLPRWSWLVLFENEPVHADGWIAGYGAPGNRLYVNRGIGFSTVPIRINCPPELTVFTLRAKEEVERELHSEAGHPSRTYRRSFLWRATGGHMERKKNEDARENEMGGRDVPVVDRDEIARRAYRRYEERGRADGDDQADWFAAEREIHRQHDRGSRTEAGSDRSSTRDKPSSQ